MLPVCLMDVALVIDHSGSIRDSNKPGGPDNWRLVIDFIKTVVKALKVSVISFDLPAVLPHLRAARYNCHATYCVRLQLLREIGDNYISKMEGNCVWLSAVLQ